MSFNSGPVSFSTPFRPYSSDIPNHLEDVCIVRSPVRMYNHTVLHQGITRTVTHGMCAQQVSSSNLLTFYWVTQHLDSQGEDKITSESFPPYQERRGTEYLPLVP